MARKLTEDEVIKILMRKKDLRIDSSKKTIKILTGNSKLPRFQKSDDLGNGSWGKIDFLRNYCGYSVIEVDDF